MSSYRTKERRVETRNHSPEFDNRDKYAGDYISICLKNLNDAISDIELRDSIYYEFKRFGTFNVKIVYDKNSRDRHGRPERIAFINFNSHEQASSAKRGKFNVPFHGYPLYIEPVFRNRSNAPHNRKRTRLSPTPRNVHRSRSVLSSASSTNEARKRYSSAESQSSPIARYSRKRSASINTTKRNKKLQNVSSRSVSPIQQRKQRKQRDISFSSSSRSSSSSSLIPQQQQQPPQSHHHHHHHHQQQHQQHYNNGRNPNVNHSKYAHYRDHLEHIDPEYDNEATRTLFVGNLDPDIEKDELKALFDRFGYIEEIDIKRVPNKKSYAFVKYVNLDMAYNAKVEMSGKIVGRYELKIGYAKLQPTNCLWISGFKSRASKRDLEKSFGHYGKLLEVDWNPGDQYAYILFDSVECAEDARNHLLGKHLPDGASSRLRIDYADPKRFDKEVTTIASSTSKKRTTKTNKRRISSDESKSISRSLTRSRSKSRTISASRSRSISKSRSKSPMQIHKSRKSRTNSKESNRSIPTHHLKRDNSNEKLISNKKQKLSQTTSNTRRDKSPKIPKHRSKSPKTRSKSPKIQQQQQQQSRSSISPVSTTSIPSNTNKDQLIKESLINRDLQTQRILNVNEINTTFKSNWYGVFTLKKIAFATKFYLLAGSKNLAEQLLPSLTQNISQSTYLPCLRITQRLRLDPAKVDELEKKLYDSNYSIEQQINIDNCQFSVLISLPYDLITNSNNNNNNTNEKTKTKIDKDDHKNDNSINENVDANGNDSSLLTNDDLNRMNIINLNQLQQRSLHNLIIYLNQKCAAGVIPLPDDDHPSAMVHAFPPNCQFSIKLLKQLLPYLKSTDLSSSSSSSAQANNANLSYALNSDYLIIVLLKN